MLTDQILKKTRTLFFLIAFALFPLFCAHLRFFRPTAFRTTASGNFKPRGGGLPSKKKTKKKKKKKNKKKSITRRRI